MTDSVLKLARETKLHRAALEALASELPQSDDALDRLIGAAVGARDNDAFVRIVFAALSARRRVDARHLDLGASFFDDPAQLAAVALHMAGDMPHGLIAAVQRENMGDERAGLALFLAASRLKDEGAPIPPELITHARILARRTAGASVGIFPLHALATLIQDDSVAQILRSRGPAPPQALVDLFIKTVIDPAKKSVMAWIPERPEPVTHSGYTVRRAVARTGRNDPCPCGSGKKYKKCCYEKDQQRLQNSSRVPGLTVEELRQQREQFLTRDELLDMRSYELVRLDPAKVAETLRPLLINRMNTYGEHEAVVQLFEKIGVPEGLGDHWLDTVDFVVRAHRKDLLLRLVELRGPAGSVRLPLGAQLLLSGAEGALPAIDRAALDVLKNPDGENAVELGYAFLDSEWPALGILVARGLAPFATLPDADALVESLLEARDRLNLSATDPVQGLIDQRFNESLETYRHHEELRETHDRLDTKERELQDARTKLLGLQTDLEKREREAREKPPAVMMPAPAPRPHQFTGDEVVVTELRRRIEDLKQELQGRHSERNQLRRELTAALKSLEELKQAESITETTNSTQPDEDALLTEDEPIVPQPLRIPEFSRKFIESLAEAPPAVARNAMVLIGRLAAGEGSAFVGMKRLHANRQILRQRVGADHRLLLILQAKTMDLLALIPRRDLERKIRSLAAVIPKGT